MEVTENEQSVNAIFKIALAAAELLVRNGAEMHRAEETILRICASRGILNPAVSVSPTVILIGDDTRDGATYIKNIKSRGSNIKKISLVNDFSRKFTAGAIEPKDAMEILKNIDNQKGYPYYLILITAGVGCGIFSMLLGGTVNDFAVTFLATLVAVYLNDKITAFSKTIFLGNFVAGFFVGIITVIFYHIGFVKNLDLIIVGAVLSLVPGVAFTSGIRDFILGELISGLARTLEAVLVAVAIAFGIGAVLFAYSLFGGI
ncbi:threonine/serine exporter family protein [Treponema pedis]|uniref:Threonine/serine exporter family protein n=1 Tax=Treponema pedis TaxID=409322 RepID=A0A7S7AVX0_9SPIR|nr:threonine/serine exporter family protein [Treponema pedis]QOW60079.1 threonine/serine exporter family protein [Treponema pedis]QSI05428.1 threonine/serine exporter [Treponema pedis]